MAYPAAGSAFRDKNESAAFLCEKMSVYLSSSVKQWRADPFHFGVMLNIAKQIGGMKEALDGGALWMLDNGAFTGRFTLAKWQAALERLRPYWMTCIGIPVPDVVGDAAATLRLFAEYTPILSAYQYPVAFVTQDSCTPDMVPWTQIQVLFIGGTDAHKRGIEAANLIAEAKRRGIWVHVGRCNSGSAMLAHWPQADSYDGTTFSRHPTQQLASILYGLQNRRTVPYQMRFL